MDNAHIQITIGEITKPLSEASNDWINAQINGRNKDGPVCVRIQISGPSAKLSLATGACASSAGGGGGGRAPNDLERDLINSWQERGLNSTEFNHGRLISFINALR